SQFWRYKGDSPPTLPQYRSEKPSKYRAESQSVSLESEFVRSGPEVIARCLKQIRDVRAAARRKDIHVGAVVDGGAVSWRHQVHGHREGGCQRGGDKAAGNSSKGEPEFLAGFDPLPELRHEVSTGLRGDAGFPISPKQSGETLFVIALVNRTHTI